MGGGSSNDQTVNQINKHMNQQMFQSLNKNNKNSNNNSKKNSPSNSKKNSPRFNNNNQNMQDYVQNDKVQKNESKMSKKSLNSQQRQTNNNSKAKSNYLNNNQSKLSKMSQIKRIKKQKIGKQWLPEKGQMQINLKLNQLFPNNHQRKFQQFSFIQQKQNQYEALFQWQRDKNEQIWTFNIYQNDQLNLSLQVDSQNQLISGNGDKWLLLSPIKQNGQIKKYKQNFIEQIIYQAYDVVRDNNIMNKSPIIKQFQNFPSDKQILFKKWTQQNKQNNLKFLHQQSKVGLDQLKIKSISKKPQNYYRLIKYYFSDSNKWLLSSFILEQNNTLKAWLIWRQLQEQQIINQLIIKQYQQLIQKHQKIINLKKDIYIYRMKIQLIQNKQI